MTVRGKILTLGGIVIAGLVGAALMQQSGYPDSTLTPGLLRTTDIADICGHDTGVYRNVPDSVKKQVYAEYHVTYPQPKESVEVDHYIPLGIGGANDIKNLGLELAPEFHLKDRVELQARLALCSGKISQQTAVQIVKDFRHYKFILGANAGEDSDDTE